METDRGGEDRRKKREMKDEISKAIPLPPKNKTKKMSRRTQKGCMILASPSMDKNDVMNTSVQQNLYLRRCIGAALWRLADWRIWVLHPVFNSGSFVHFHVGDGEDALPIGT